MCTRAAEAWCGYRGRDSNEEHAGSDDAAPTDPLQRAHNYSLVAVTPRCALSSAGEVGGRPFDPLRVVLGRPLRGDSAECHPAEGVPRRRVDDRKVEVADQEDE